MTIMAVSLDLLRIGDSVRVNGQQPLPSWSPHMRQVGDEGEVVTVNTTPVTNSPLIEVSFPTRHTEPDGQYTEWFYPEELDLLS